MCCLFNFKLCYIRDYSGETAFDNLEAFPGFFNSLEMLRLASPGALTLDLSPANWLTSPTRSFYGLFLVFYFLNGLAL